MAFGVVLLALVRRLDHRMAGLRRRVRPRRDRGDAALAFMLTSTPVPVLRVVRNHHDRRVRRRVARRRPPRRRARPRPPSETQRERAARERADDADHRHSGQLPGSHGAREQTLEGPHHRLRADRHRAGGRVRLRRHAGLQGDARGGRDVRPRQLEPGDDHDRRGRRRRRLHRAARPSRSSTRIIERERPDGLLPTLGGQTGLNLAVALARRGRAREVQRAPARHAARDDAQGRGPRAVPAAARRDRRADADSR